MTVSDVGRSATQPLAAPTRVPRLRATLALARIEGSLLVRSLLVLGGLLAGAGLVWGVTGHVLPLWWDVGWRLGYGQMLLSTTVLVATQLAAGRVRRDGLQDLYASLPTPAGARTRAQLLGTLGALPASFVLVGAGATVFVLRGAIGTPSPSVLVAGVLLVLAGALIGVAVGVRFAHPLAGVLAALVWFGTFSQTNRFNDGLGWVVPWRLSGALGALPAPLSRYPPAAAHAAELAAVGALAAAVALALTATENLRRALLAGVAMVALAVAGLAGVVQMRPIPTSSLDRLAEAITDPSAVQQCSIVDGVHYCLYPGFASMLPALHGPVSGVLEQVPARPAHALTVRQVADTTLQSSELTFGHARQQVARWTAQLRSAPIHAPAADAIYPVVGRWPAGSRTVDARFDVSLAAAEWAVGLPPTTGNAFNLDAQCVPVGQAREAIAMWLAIRATHPSTSRLAAGMPGLGPGRGSFLLVGDTAVAIWGYPGSTEGYLASGPALTADGFLLARAMAALPAQHVEQVVAQQWARWLDPRTDGQALAAALGIPRPAFPVPPVVAANPPRGPGSPVCP